MSETSERQQLIEELQSIKERIKKIEDQLADKGIQKQDMVVSKLEPTIEQDSVSPSEGEALDTVSTSKGETIDIKPYEILTIEGIINLINIGNRKPLEQFKLQAKIVVASTREGSQYGKTRPQEVIIADEKNNQFKLLNWHKSMDQELRDLKDQWVVFDSVYLKENDPRFLDNQFMFFTIKGQSIQFSIHSSKKFKIIFSISQKIIGGKKEK